MKKAWLITNAWLHWDKFEQQFNQLIAAAAAVIELERVTTDWVVSHLDGPLPDVAIVMDKDVAAIAQLEALGVRAVNSARAVALCDNKAHTHAALTRAGITHPFTLTAPLAYRRLERHEWARSEFVAGVEDRLGYPAVVKHAVGSWGSGVFIADSREQLLDVLENAWPVPVIAEEFIAESAGHDIRIFMVGRQPVAAMRRFGAEGDFRSNITGGGRAQAWDPPAEYVDVAQRAMDALELDIAAVDFLHADVPMVGEVNSNAQFVTLAETTGVDIARAVIEHVARIA